ncbi:hypothetical protein [Streptomyces sp. NBC_00566]|uniref:hypothetical protein n=1 Tax=Streptomyces sp. NBC_00566 TaxID=2975778 RepID=UPI002E808C01|nr:hypothetical protein [Streptomyces sp. NBC_00566]WUB90504.1 hypothetical protein OG812_29605 [Streptomyces sp. NBC_00566]
MVSGIDADTGARHLFRVSLTLNPAAVKVVWDDDHALLTGNGPRRSSEQAARLAEIVRNRTNSTR